MSDTKKTETAKKEEEVLAFWNEQKIFEKSLEKPSPKGEFVFYDGPPFATGLPHHGHLLGSTSKDLFGRYKTMRGYHVRRRWGWDTHGLPIESKVEEKLGLKSKKDILDIGVEKFNKEARAMVLEYVSEWKRYVDRLGRWVDFDNSYKTFDPTYTESVWWALKKIHTNGHLYEGYKVLMYCPHCETPLAKAEIAMDNTYKDVTDETVTVKFRVLDIDRLALKKPVFILAWTTTPWTLPGNVALAVGTDIDYAIVDAGDEYLIVARERAEALGLSLEGAEYKKGSELVGLLYEPLYTIEKAKQHTGKRYQVVAADFVTTSDGTGVVHTAVMYGEDDFELGKKENLPMVQLLNTDGTFNADAPEFIQGMYFKKGGKFVTADLESRELLFKKEPYVHSYPHCYRCGTALIYNAVSSWFINIQAIKSKLLSENEHINWIPEHLKEGRFRHIVETAPDWTISRNRFWASPLPIWKDAHGEVTVIGSLADLKQKTKKSGNTYLVMRHGESTKNVAPHIVTGDFDAPYPLTEKGREEVLKAAESLKGKVDIIFTSPVLRAKETTKLIAETLDLDASKVITDNRLREFEHGSWEGRSLKDYEREFPVGVNMFERGPEGGENWTLVRKRVGEFLYDMENTHRNKRILIVSHGDPLALLGTVASGLSKQEVVQKWDEHYPKKGVVTTLNFVPLPHNDDYELDYHLPYIDRVQLENEKGELLTRIPEVVDGWVESGSMPFAEYNYPFENKQEFERRTPGDFISEYIGQTRAWFYYMHVMSVHLFGHRAFNNVVTTGNINAADGQKLSKSKQNFTDPYEIFDKYGADAERYYLMSSVAMIGEDMQFKDDDVKDVHNKVINILRNTLAFFSLYEDEAPKAANTSEHVLDRWILLRLEAVITEVTMHFDRFDTVRATRPMRDFVEDFSTWFVRRSRDRVKSDNEEDKERALTTMRYVLREFSKIIAPVMPFVADEVYRAVREEGEPESVHLAAWPEQKKGFFVSLFGTQKKEHWLIGDMREVRELVSLALEARQSAGIKVRQPLKSLKVNSPQLAGKQELLGLIKDELNVKEVVMQTGIEGRIELETAMTPELEEEGKVRELMREIQDLRKKADLSPKDKAALFISGDIALLEKYWDEVSKAANLNSFEKGNETHVEKA